MTLFFGTLPQNPSYYDTKSVADYISPSEQSQLYAFSNNHYINHCILLIEQLFDNQNFLGYQLIHKSFDTNDSYFDCDTFHISDNDEKTEKEQILNILKLFSSHSLEDMNKNELIETREYLEMSGIWKIDNREVRFESYKKMVNYNANSLNTHLCEELISGIQKSVNHNKNSKDITINGIHLKTIAFTLSESEHIKNAFNEIRLWLKEYDKKIKVLEIIKYFENKQCNLLMIDRISGKPSLYEKAGQHYIFQTDQPVNISDKKLRHYAIIDQSFRYLDFLPISQISEDFPQNKFDSFIRHISIEKERKCLKETMNETHNPVSKKSVNRI